MFLRGLKTTACRVLDGRLLKQRFGAASGELVLLPQLLCRQCASNRIDTSSQKDLKRDEQRIIKISVNSVIDGNKKYSIKDNAIARTREAGGGCGQIARNYRSITTLTATVSHHHKHLEKVRTKL